MHDEYVAARERWPIYARGKGYQSFVDPSELEEQAIDGDHPQAEASAIDLSHEVCFSSCEPYVY